MECQGGISGQILEFYKDAFLGPWVVLKDIKALTGTKSDRTPLDKGCLAGTLSLEPNKSYAEVFWLGPWFVLKDTESLTGTKSDRTPLHKGFLAGALSLESNKSYLPVAEFWRTLFLEWVFCLKKSNLKQQSKGSDGTYVQFFLHHKNINISLFMITSLL